MAMAGTVKVGDKVTVLDYSEAHGEVGVVFLITRGLVIVELEGQDPKVSWPCYEHELRVAEP